MWSEPDYTPLGMCLVEVRVATYLGTNDFSGTAKMARGQVRAMLVHVAIITLLCTLLHGGGEQTQWRSYQEPQREKECPT